jgi:hypothetical protein
LRGAVASICIDERKLKDQAGHAEKLPAFLTHKKRPPTRYAFNG